MFYLSKETQHQADVAHMAYFPDEEPVDTDFFRELRYEKQRIPARFHEAIDNDTLHSDLNMRQAYYGWCEQIIAAHQHKCEQIYKKRLTIATKFESAAGEVFNDSLHDGEILHILRDERDVTLFLDMRGGFTAKALIQLTFKDVQETGNLARDYVYDELMETENGYALRVLSGHPYEQWTIHFHEVVASFVFRPKAYTEREQYTEVSAYVADLTADLQYLIVENHQFVAVDITQIKQRDTGYYSGTYFLGETAIQVIERIYCDRYEDPYAHFSESVSLEELEQAALSDDLTLRVRAFNTMFEINEQAAPIVNRVLRVIQLEEHEEMLMRVIAEHFDKLGLLESDVKSRWL